MKVVNEDKSSYSNAELKTMFLNIPTIMNNLIAENSIIDKYNKLKLDNKISQGTKDNYVVQKDVDDLCPICLDDLTNGDELDYCKFSCGKQIHKLCYEMWTKKNKAQCVFCKKNWYHKEISMSYINLCESN
jgi:hypothetical protein